MEGRDIHGLKFHTWYQRARAGSLVDISKVYGDQELKYKAPVVRTGQWMVFRREIWNGCDGSEVACGWLMWEYLEEDMV